MAISTIGVSSTLTQLRLQNNGSLEVPSDFNQAGWFAQGVTPGEVGTAVIAGHVDSYRGPAVFYRLGAMRPGDTVTVDRADGSLATMVVYRVERYAKDKLPTDAVFASVGQPELRLITCGGSFDRETGHYRDNIVVFARLVA